MAEELQALLDRISDEGVKKAEEQGRKILDAAKKEAEKTRQDAAAKAEATMKAAEQDASSLKQRTEAALRQCSRDIIISLQAELQNRLRNLVKNSINEAMTPEVMGRMLVEMTKNYSAQSAGAQAGLELMLSPEGARKAESLFKGSLLAELKSRPEISLSREMTGGIQVRFKDGDAFFDFSDDAISSLICAYIGPKLAALVK